ncbi:MAG: hypothetical protein A2X49_17300 [Lentisphaerae bacterium GWF2_52_8]|nr:MAG: hypothetical protein A2X49_17300 [Lentisphaerae bacterium GWF2_52_8]
MNKYLKTALCIVALSSISGAAYALFTKVNPESKPGYRLGEIKKCDLVSSISATGTIEPEELVDVGAQVTGQILSFGKDANGISVDYGSYVKAGDVLTNIDDATYQAETESAEASMKQAEASLENAKADLKQLKAKLELANADMERANRLKNNVLSKAEYDTYKSNFDVAAANIDVGMTKILAAEASLLSAKANLSKARRNLSYCTIRSPVDGVVIDRRVNIGQTVVSSMSTSSLFLIAKDLKRMQIWVSVNEADIGRLKPGQPVSFTVDAFPNETFKGSVSKIRLNATMTQNVVTYTVEVAFDNSNGRLLPYLTANVVFEVERLDSALTVPNSALRWSPKDSDESPDLKDGSNATIWTPGKDAPKAIKVKTISTDGSVTAIAAQEGIAEGLPLILGQLSAKEITESKKSTNPFLPQFKKNGKQQGPPPPP